MRKILLLTATVLVPILGSTAALADTSSSNLDLTIDTQSATSVAGNSTTVVNTSSRQTNVSATIQDFAFSPGTMTVPQGTTVTWTNHDNTAHTVTGDTSSGPASSLIQPGQSYSFTFSATGTSRYHCSVHPEMTGTVTVTASSSSSSTTQSSSSSGSSQQSASSASVNSTSGSTTNANASSSPSASPSASASPSSTTLPSTGPVGILVLFVIPALLGSGLYYLYLLSGRKRLI